ncbi:hypothetical protein TREPR_0740 [Treponema primitia ZAS-2]|uniref:Uncharacterized protein n=1 Tax=Treponema primitia (strain ATCC BAA-887 / DSM 12427 / ZAS-2) TaxID=545694 RepID=F5YJE9_TREPZ|nr:hypothetical protein [Treponema primitia]AEF84864.1 hypothetical protein TREPR_0740 [Treponema primitia ZAS-2]
MKKFLLIYLIAVFSILTDSCQLPTNDDIEDSNDYDTNKFTITTSDYLTYTAKYDGKVVNAAWSITGGKTSPYSIGAGVTTKMIGNYLSFGLDEVSDSFIVKATYKNMTKEYPILYNRTYNLVLNTILENDWYFAVNTMHITKLGTDIYFTTGFEVTAAVNTGTNSDNLAVFKINKPELEIVSYLESINFDGIFSPYYTIEDLYDYIRPYSGRITFLVPDVDGYIRYIYIENVNGYSVGNMGDQTKWSIRPK